MVSNVSNKTYRRELMRLAEICISLERKMIEQINHISSLQQNITDHTDQQKTIHTLTQELEVAKSTLIGYTNKRNSILDLG